MCFNVALTFSKPNGREAYTALYLPFIDGVIIQSVFPTPLPVETATSLPPFCSQGGQSPTNGGHSDLISSRIA